MELGENKARLSKGGRSSFTFNPKGARVEELVLKGHRISGLIQRGDGKLVTTHPGFPNFDEDTAGLGLPRHGVMRDMLVPAETRPGGVVYVEAPIVAAKYPEGVVVTQTFQIDLDSFTMEASVENRGTVSAPGNFGYHQYFLADRGLNGATINDREIRKNAEDDALFEWYSQNIIKIPGLPALLVEQTGLPLVNTWTGRTTSNRPDSHYFSASGVAGNFRERYFGSPASMIEPGEIRCYEYKIALAS